METPEKKGLAKGREQGREEERNENGLKMKQLGVGVDIITQVTALSAKEIEQL